MVYDLDLLFVLTLVYSVSRVKRLRRVHGGEGAIIPWKDVSIEESLTYVECWKKSWIIK